jgi:hypothetical protein
MKSPSIRWFVAICLSTFLLGCYAPGGPVPEEPVAPALREPVPQKVIVEQEEIDSPAPTENGVPPEACDRIRFVRYRPETPDGQPKEVGAILVLLPGYMSGAGEFDYVARQLVSMAEAEGPKSIEVWAMDRRPNCLEDLAGMDAAEAAGELPDPSLAVDYYYFGSSIGGKTFAGLLQDSQVPYLSEFGLRLFMEDVYSVILQKVPNQADRRALVFVGGHSQGTTLTGAFAGWDFDGNPGTLDDAGFRNCAGLVLLDGPVFYWDLGRFNNIGETDYFQRLADIRSGAQDRLNYFEGVTAESLAILELVGIYAAGAPDEESTLLREVPYSEDVAYMIKLIHTRDLGHFLVGLPAMPDFRFTNEALLGVIMDDNFMPMKMMQASMGFLHGGPVVEKDFPGSVAHLLGLERAVDMDGLFIPWDAGPLTDLGSGPLYTWVDFDEVGNVDDPDHMDSEGVLTYTTLTEEVTDIQDFARMTYRGPSNFLEWYYAARLMLDLGAAGAPFNALAGLPWFQNAAVDVPVIAFGAPHGDAPDLNAWDDYKASIASTDFTTLICPGYNHLDINLAAVDRPSHRENLVFRPLLDFLTTRSSGSVLVP